MFELSNLKGNLTLDKDLSSLTWLRVGGPADYFFQPADEADLAKFLVAIPPQLPIFPMGVGSNLLVRDGGYRGAVLRLGRGFNQIKISGTRVTAGASALDTRVALRAAEAGLDLTFLHTIPGTVGGAVSMNAGCYGCYTSDHFFSARLITRAGDITTLGKDDLTFDYRHANLPEGSVITEVVFEAEKVEPSLLIARMNAQRVQRDKTQPTKELSAGSAFRNPSGFSSTGRHDDLQDLKAWKIIDEVGMRGLQLGGAKISEKHPNFLVNTGTASAADLENLGELIRKRVSKERQIELVWEITRIGEKDN